MAFSAYRFADFEIFIISASAKFSEYFLRDVLRIVLLQIKLNIPFPDLQIKILLKVDGFPVFRYAVPVF
jgi:hypothetical protein